MNTIDRVQGMLASVALADALGAPHEFKCNHSNVYTGKLELQPFRFNRFKNEIVYYDIGPTDDTELTLALLMTIQGGEYCRKRALRAYLDWANSGCPHLGKNTRALFYGVKTERGYTNRYNKVTADGGSQSNGSLMRCSPLALVAGDWREAVVEDCDLTNPNDVNRQCSLVYVGWLRLLLAGENDVFSNWETEELCDEVRSVLHQEERDVSGYDKGWVLHALWCCKQAFQAESFAELMKFIIEKKGDTDTNAAIAGALYGARVGFTALMQEQAENWTILTYSPYNDKQREKGRAAYVFPENLSEYLECILP